MSVDSKYSSVICILHIIAKAPENFVGKVSGTILVEDDLVSAIQSRNCILMFCKVKIIKHSGELLKDCVL